MSKNKKRGEVERIKRKVKMKHKGVRPRSVQNISSELEDLVKTWNKSDDKKAFQERFQRKE